MPPNRAIVLLCCLVLGTVASATVVVAQPAASSNPTEVAYQPANASAVGAGDRLQGIVGVQEAEVVGELESRGIGIAVTMADSNASAARVVASQVSVLESRLDDLRARQTALQRARANGSLSTGESAAELAIVAARISAVRQVANRTGTAAGRLPDAALARHGVNRSAIQHLQRRAATLTDSETASIARSIAGRATGRALGTDANRTVPRPAENRSNRTAASASERRDGSQDDRSSTASDTTIDDDRSDDRDRSSILAAIGARAVDASDALVSATGRVLTAATSQFIGAARAQPAPTDRPLFEVVVDRDGNARVTLVLTFDLTNDADTRAFETMVDDQAAQRDVRTRFRNRMQSVANQSERVTGREMAVSDPRINLTRSGDGETGVIATSVAWAGLAAVQDDHLVITEPFASGFTPDREFRVRITAPGGYHVTTARPEPADRFETSVAWTAGTDLSGFTLAFSPEGQTPLPETVIEGFQSTATIATPVGGSDTGLPGFGPLVALVALLGGTLLALGRRDDQ